MVDTEKTKEKMLHCLKTKGLESEIEEIGGDYYIRIGKEFAGLDPQLTKERDYLLLIGNQSLGGDQQELGVSLMRSFFKNLVDSNNLPRQIILLNSAVRLACENSPILQNLLDLNRKGVGIFACNQSLAHYGLKEKLCVGENSSMYFLAKQISLFPRVVTLP